MPHQNLIIWKYIHHYILHLNPTQFSKNNEEVKYQHINKTKCIDF